GAGMNVPLFPCGELIEARLRAAMASGGTAAYFADETRRSGGLRGPRTRRAAEEQEREPGMKPKGPRECRGCIRPLPRIAAVSKTSRSGAEHAAGLDSAHSALVWTRCGWSCGHSRDPTQE